MAIKKPVIKSKNTKRGIIKPRPSKADYRTQIVVQFHDGINLPYTNDVGKFIKEYNVGPLEQLVKKFPGISISPLYSGVKPETLKKLIGKAKEMDPTYKEGNFFQYFRITCPVEFKHQEILEELSAWNNIKTLKTSARYSHPSVSYSDEARAIDQNYLDAAPGGIGAKTVWDNTLIPGSDGAGIKFCDIEKGWTLNHQDLGTINQLAGSVDNNGRAEGTSVLGIVGAADNGQYCIGIAPASDLNVISYVDAPPPVGELTLEDAILFSLTYLGFGDVLLIESQAEALYSGISCKVPVEVNNEVFNAIRLASALGIIVIEPGGNGNGSDTCVNLDDLQIGGQFILYPGSAQYHGDSGAILVTAAHSSTSIAGSVTTHEIMPWAPKGERIDCYAWGENINTLSSDISGATDQYTDTYGGTSGAAAIIAGAVLNMQSMAIANQGFRFSPLQIRNILKNASYGTPLSHDPGIGSQEQLPINMPNLNAFATTCLNTFPDLYLRDYIGDDGLPHSGSISWSPDVINKNSSVPDPQTEFGGLNVANRNNDGLSENATYNATNYLYFRALNQGGALPTNAKVTAFYSEPATLLTPSMLNLIGEINFPYAIPFGDNIENLTVSNELSWIPTSPVGHYCFVAVISCDEDPSVDPKKIPDWDWDKYYKYIRENNNVTWKNFDIVEMKKSSSSPAPEEEPEQTEAPDIDPVEEQDPVPDTSAEQEPAEELPEKGWLGLDFISPGLPDRNQKMSLEIISKLPRSVKVLLQVPLSWKKMVYRGSPYVLHNKKRRIGFAPINPSGKSGLDDLLFRANSKVHLKLFIHVPDKLKKQSYSIAVRQLLNGNEVGRYTWKLIPPKKADIKIEKKPVKRK